MVNNNKRFFQDNTPPSDPGDIDPEDKSFLNYAKRQGGPPVIGESDYKDPFLQDTKDINKRITKIEQQIPPAETTMEDNAWMNVDPQFEEKRAIATPREYKTTLEATRHIADIFDYEISALPENRQKEMTKLKDFFLTPQNTIGMSPDEAAIRYFDEGSKIAGDRSRSQRRYVEGKVEVDWKKTLEESLIKHGNFLNKYGSLAGESLGKEMLIEGHRRPSEIALDVKDFILDGPFSIAGGLGIARLAGKKVGLKQIVDTTTGKITYQGKFMFGLGRKASKITVPANPFFPKKIPLTKLRNLPGSVRFLQILGTYDIWVDPFTTGIWQSELLKDHPAYERALIAHKAMYGDGFMSKIFQWWRLSTANHHSTEGQKLAAAVDGWDFMGMDIEPGEWQGILTAGIMGALYNAGGRLFSKLGRKFNEKAFYQLATGQGIHSKYSTNLNRILLEKYTNKHLKDLTTVFGSRSGQVQDFQYNLQKYKITPEDVYPDKIDYKKFGIESNLDVDTAYVYTIDERMPINKKMVDAVLGFWEGLPNLKGNNMLNWLSNPYRTVTRNFQNIIHWNTHPGARWQNIDLSKLYIKPIQLQLPKASQDLATGNDSISKLFKDITSTFRGGTKQQYDAAAKLLHFTSITQKKNITLNEAIKENIKVIKQNGYDYNQNPDDLTLQDRFKSEQIPIENYALVPPAKRSQIFNSIINFGTDNFGEDFLTNMIKTPKSYTGQFLYKSLLKNYLKLNKNNSEDAFKLALSTYGLDEYIGIAKNKTVPFETIYASMRTSYMGYTISVNDVMALDDMGNTSVLHNFTKPNVIGNRKFYFSEKYVIEQVPGQEKYRLIDLTNIEKTEIVGVFDNAQDAQAYANQVDHKLIPNALAGDFFVNKLDNGSSANVDSLNSLEIQRALNKSGYNVIGRAGYINDEKTLNLDFKFLDSGLKQNIINKLSKYPNLSITDLTKKGLMSELDQKDLFVEIQKQKFLRSEFNWDAAYANQFNGYDATGIASVKFKTAKSPDGSDVFSVSEIKIHDDYLTRNKDVIPLSKTKEWKEFLTMVDNVNNFNKQGKLFDREQIGIWKEDLSFVLENYKPSNVKFKTIDDIDKYLRPKDDWIGGDPVTGQGGRPIEISDDPIGQINQEQKEALLRYLQNQENTSKYIDTDLFDFAKKNDFLIQIENRGGFTDENKFDVQGFLLDERWNNYRLKLSPGTPKFEPEQINKMVAQLVVQEFVGNSSAKTLVIDDLITSTMSGSDFNGSLKSIDPNILHGVDITSIMYAKTGVDKFLVFPMGINSASNSTSMSKETWTQISTYWKQMNNPNFDIFKAVADIGESPQKWWTNNMTKNQFEIEDFLKVHGNLDNFELLERHRDPQFNEALFMQFQKFMRLKKRIGMNIDEDGVFGGDFEFVEQQVKEYIGLSNQNLFKEFSDKFNTYASLDEINKTYGKTVSDFIKRNEMKMNSQQGEKGITFGAFSFSNIKPNTKVTNDFRTYLLGINQGANWKNNKNNYSRILKKGNADTEKINADSEVIEVKNSIPSLIKQLLEKVDPNAKIDLITTKYNKGPSAPQITFINKADDFVDPDEDLTEVPLMQSQEFQRGKIKQRLLDDQEILDVLKEYRQQSVYGQGDEIDDLISHIQKNIDVLFSLTPYNGKVANTMPTQAIYAEGINLIKKKYDLNEDNILQLIEDAFAPTGASVDPASQKLVDGITFLKNGKPLAITDWEEITDFELYRKVKGQQKASTKLIRDSQIIISAMKYTTPSDMFHEIGHVIIPTLEEFLDTNEYNKVLDFYSVKNRKWTRDSHEKLADDFADYMGNPNKGFWKDVNKNAIVRMFEQLIIVFKKLFGVFVTENTGLSPEVKKFIYKINKHMPKEGFSKIEKELIPNLNNGSKLIANEIDAKHVRKIQKLEEVSEHVKEVMSDPSGKSPRKPGEPYLLGHKKGDEPYSVWYDHELPMDEETTQRALLRQVEGARQYNKNIVEKWTKETHKEIYDKYKIKIENLTNNFSEWGTTNDTLDLFAALHGEILITNPKFITKDMVIFQESGKTYGIKTPVSRKEARASLTDNWKKEMYDQVLMLRLDEEYETLTFLGDTFRAIDVGDLDKTRLSFNAEIFLEKMMGIPEYFPRLWQTKSGDPIKPNQSLGSTNFGLKPGFAKGRVNKTFIEMLIGNPDKNFEGLLPSTPDPALMMAQRRIGGLNYREVSVMMNTLNRNNLLKTFDELVELYGIGNEKEIKASWGTPEIGPAFEGMVVPKGEGDVAFTRKYLVPKEIKTFLENIYNRSDEGFIEKVDQINMLSKQIKVAFAPYQHTDMWYRAINAGFTGSVFETFVSVSSKGMPIPNFVNLKNPKRLAQGIWGVTGAPISLTTDILFSNIPVVGDVWRKKLSEQLSSDKSVNALLKGNAGKVTFKMLVQQGSGFTGDRGITNAVRESLSLYKKNNPNLPKKALKELGKINQFFQDGLFEGTYRYAQAYGLKYYILPYSSRVNTDFTPEQHAAWAATYSNRMFSTLGLFQEWIKGETQQKFFNTLIFSRIEGQALPEQWAEMTGKQMEDLPLPFKLGARNLEVTTGKRKGFNRKRAQFWSQYNVSWFATFWIMGNLINAGWAVSKYGAPKDLKDFEENYIMKDEQMNPLQKNIDEDATFGFMPQYNSKFMSPIIGDFGRNGTPVYMDQVGQMDTFFRWFQPDQAIQSRLGVGPAAAVRQATERTFFGQPFETPEMKAIQAAMDLSAPWMANSLLNVVGSKYPKTQKYLPTSEKRLGVAGQAGQVFVNLRSINNEGLRQYSIDQYKRQLTDPEQISGFPNKWMNLTPEQKDQIFNTFPNIKDEFDERKMESYALEQLQAESELKKGSIYSESTARLANDTIRKQINLIENFVENRGIFGSELYLESIQDRGQNPEYKKLEKFRDELKNIKQDHYAGKDFLEQVLAMKDYVPPETNENTEALTQYYNEMEKYYDSAGVFLVEDWINYRDNTLMPSYNEGQRNWVEVNIGRQDVLHLKDFKDWENEAFENNYMYNYSEYRDWWAERLSDIKEQRDAIPEDRYLTK